MFFLSLAIRIALFSRTNGSPRVCVVDTETSPAPAALKSGATLMPDPSRADTATKEADGTNGARAHEPASCELRCAIRLPRQVHQQRPHRRRSGFPLAHVHPVHRVNRLRQLKRKLRDRRADDIERRRLE